MKRTILLATAALGLITTANASDVVPLRSPKAKAQAEALRTVSTNARDAVDRGPANGSPKGREFAASLRTVPAGNADVDLVHGPRPSLSPRDPRYETALREQRAPDFQVAPLK